MAAAPPEEGVIIVLTLLHKPLGLLIGVAGGIATNAVFARVVDAFHAVSWGTRGWTLILETI